MKLPTPRLVSAVLFIVAVLYMLGAVAVADPPSITPSTESVTVTTSGTIAFPAGRQLVQTFTSATRAATIPVAAGQVGWETDTGIVYRATAATAGSWSAISGGSGGAWGSITGTLSAQTDLQSALDAKLSTAAAAGLYQPLDSDLTSIAALATTAYGRSLLTSADAAAARGLLSLSNVENIALSTWAGSGNLGTLGTISAGSWQATPIAAAHGGTGQTSLGDTADVLSVPQPAGAWAVTTAYSQGDLVSNAGSYWLCTTEHESSSDDEPGAGVNYASYWSVFVVSGGISDGDKGDIVVSGGGATYSVDSAVKSTGGNGSSDNGKLVVYNSNGSLRSAIVELPGAGVVGGQLSLYNSANTAAATLRYQGSSNILLYLPSSAGTLLLAAGSGGSLTDLNATSITAGTLDAARLAASGVTPGSYTSANITVDAAGRVTAASNGASAMRRTIWLPAAAGIPRTTSGCGVGSWETATHRINYDTLDFDAASDEKAQWLVKMPDEWDGGTVKAKISWTAASGSGAVYFEVKAGSLADDDALDAALGTAATTNDSLTAAGDLDETAATGACTVGGSPAGGKYVFFELARDADHGSDTLAADALVLGLTVQYQESSSPAAW